MAKNRRDIYAGMVVGIGLLAIWGIVEITKPPRRPVTILGEYLGRPYRIRGRAGKYKVDFFENGAWIPLRHFDFSPTFTSIEDAHRGAKIMIDADAQR